MSALQIPERRFYSAEDLLEMPSDARFELIRGELFAMPPPPGAHHGSTTLSIAANVKVFVDEHNLGECFAAETGFQIAADPDSVLAADFAFVAIDRLSGRLPDKYLVLAPDIVMETRSPSDRKRAVAEKTLIWLQAGVRVVWILDPKAKTLTIHRAGHIPLDLGPNDTLTDEENLPGFSYPLARLFR